MSKEREGLIYEPVIDALDPKQQAPQAPEDRHGPKYDNDTAKGWLRGNKLPPHFDKHKAGR